MTQSEGERERVTAREKERVFYRQMAANDVTLSN